MTIKLPELPYDMDALAPFMSRDTLEYHYGKHHRGYVDKVNKLIAGTDYQDLSLEDIVVKASRAEDELIFNNAAQALNHEMLWHSLSPEGGSKPTGALLEAIVDKFGSLEQFKQAFMEAATSQFGSGWVWLVAGDDGLEIQTTLNADTPVARGEQPLLTLDVWEHAYYLDYRNNRQEYANSFLDRLVNWSYATKNFTTLDRAA